MLPAKSIAATGHVGPGARWWLLLTSFLAVASVLHAQPEAPPRIDVHGDPLPAGALARLGTLRLRHGSFIYAACMSSDGKMVASTGGHQVTNLWDAASGKKIREFSGLQIYANDAVAFSPNGKELAVGGQGGIFIFDTQSGVLRSQLEALPVFSIAFSADGRLLATGHESAGTSLWESASGKKLFQLQAKSSGQKVGAATSGRTFVWSVAFSPDGGTLAAAEDGRVVLWDVVSGEQRREFQGDNERVFAVAFSPDGARLATAGKDRIIRLWEVATGKLLQKLEGHRDAIAALVFSPDGKLLASGSGTGPRRAGGAPREFAALRLWDATTGKEVGQLGEHGEGVLALGFSKDGRTLMSAGGGSIRLWDFPSRREINTLGGHRGWVGSIAFSSDGKMLASGGADNTVRLWSVPTGREIRQLAGLKSDVDGLAFSPKGDLVVAGSRDGFVVVWGAALGNEKRRFESEKGQYSVALSPDSKTVAAGTWKGTIFLWDMETGRELRRLPPLKEHDEIHSLSFSPDGKLLAATVFNQGDFKRSVIQAEQKPGYPVRIWDVKRGTATQQLDGHTGPTMSVAFSLDGKRLVSTGWDGTVRLWETATRKQVWQYTPGKGGSLRSVAFTPDGRQVACVGYTDTVHLCAVTTGKESQGIKGPQSALTVVAFSQQGEIMASAGMDGTVLLWDARSVAADTIRPAETKHPASKINSLWTDLSSDDVPRAHRALWELAEAPSQAIPLLRERLQPAKPDAKSIDKLIADLDSNKFAEREQATLELRNLGELAGQKLRKAQLGQPSAEMRKRLDNLVQRLDNGVLTPEQLRSLRAIEVLEHIATIQAREVLMTLAKGEEAAAATQEAKAALERLARK